MSDRVSVMEEKNHVGTAASAVPARAKPGRPVPLPLL